MSPWRTVASVVAGLVVTVVLSVATLLALPVVGLATAAVVGPTLPTWLFAAPLALCGAGGGATTGRLQRGDGRRCAVLGGVAAALGLLVVGVVLGLVALVFLLGMTPAHGAEPNLAEAVRTVGTLGAGVGAVTGTVSGSIGGVAGSHWRRRTDA
ncbi:hypothetical protein [Salinigranum sp.]|uniref:hypothetical protein n=1 Tax=Salinigranum sp. TaxID=1966351 RepID=UPI003565D3D7